MPRVVTFVGIVTPVNIEQFLNIIVGMDVMPVPMVTFVIAVQFKKQLVPTEVTVFGITNDVSDVQFEKQSKFMVVIFAGMVTDVRDEHEANIPSDKVEIPDPMVTFVIAVQF